MHRAIAPTVCDLAEVVNMFLYTWKKIERFFCCLLMFFLMMFYSNYTLQCLSALVFLSLSQSRFMGLQYKQVLRTLCQEFRYNCFVFFLLLVSMMSDVILCSGVPKSRPSSVLTLWEAELTCRVLLSLNSLFFVRSNWRFHVELLQL